MASSRSLLLGTRRNNQVSNLRGDDYQSERNDSQIYQRRFEASHSRNDYMDSPSNLYSNTHIDRYSDSLQDRQSSNVGVTWNHRHLDREIDFMDNRHKHHLENEYDQYISELDTKSRYSDVGLNNTNSDFKRYSNSRDFDRNPISNFDTNDRYVNVERNSEFSNRVGIIPLERQSNSLSNLVKNNHLLGLERANLRNNHGTSSITPWQFDARPAITTNILPLDGVSNKVVSTIELATNLLNLFTKPVQQPQHNNPPSLLDLPVHAPQSKPFNSGTGRTLMGNQQHSATDSRFGTGKRKSHWGLAGQSQLSKNLPRKDNNISSKPKTSNPSNAGNTRQIENVKKAENIIVDTDYNDILPNYLYCHICKKSITKPKLFATHLKGKVHAAMMVNTEKEYALAADQMREEIRAVESMKPNRHNSLNFHCSMCKIDAVDPREHRGSAGHRKLKKYLHPTCHNCDLNFPTKILYDEHLLTAEHLKKMQFKSKPQKIQNTKAENTKKTKNDGSKVMQIFTMDMEMSYVRERFDKKRERKTKDDNTKDNNSKEQNEKKKDDGVTVDSDNLVLDYMEGDDLTGVTPNMLPAYSTERGVGDSFLSEFRCVQCKLCNELLDSEETAKIHLKTWRHHRLFTKLILNKIKSTDKDDDQQNKDSGSADAKEQESNKESGDLKRLKTSDNTFVAVQKEQEDEEMPENDGNVPDSQLPPNDELEDWDQEDEKADIKQENDDDVILVE